MISITGLAKSLYTSELRSHTMTQGDRASAISEAAVYCAEGKTTPVVLISLAIKCAA